LIFLLQFNLVEAQEIDFIKGKLINSKDNEPIPFATLLIKNKNKGVISNSDGGFQIPYELYKRDTLIISSIGYSSKEIPINSLDKNEINLIVLIEKIEQLDEILLVNTPKKKERRSAKEIVNLAIKRISKNYDFTPFSYIGYYRDYQIKNEQYLNLNEALVEVFDPGFGVSDLKSTQTRIYQYKNNLNFNTDTIAAQPYDYNNKSKLITSASINNRGGNEFTILRIHDAIRNYNVNSYDFVNQLDLDFVKNHDFKLLPSTFIDDTSLYSIDIYRNKNNIKATGKIFISKGDFKIYKMQYAVFDLSKAKGNDDEKLLYEIVVEYKPQQGTMYPNYISFNNVFEVLRPPLFFPVDAKIYYDQDNFNGTSKLSFNKMEIIFNNTPQTKGLLRKRNYDVWYKEEKLKIINVELNKDNVILYLDEELEVPSWKLLQKSVEEDINLEIKNIKDIHGNLINDQEYATYNQFREFFVQELKVNSTKLLDNLYMNKNKSIFKDQPLAPFENTSDYWLNTPLKKVKNFESEN
jgi:hypothetical protein